MAARGDRRPSTHTDCAGAMQFGREPESGRSRPEPDPATRSSARTRWEDDGGQQLADRQQEPSMAARLGARS